MKDLSKRYYLFSMSEYYPQGGLNDVIETFEDGDEAIKACKEPSLYGTDGGRYVYDRILGGIIFNLYE